ncbi:MAG: DUF1883 domain-containing protein [Clostridiales Family XIII bacterium]|jgi:hypothetical protein|nr:DUF1883 domain-containing protein [Clostridiales Family XIII bacterium]
MQYLLYDLGQAREGAMTEIALGYAANVRLMDADNYALFRQNAPHKFTGGYIQRSPYKAVLPSDGHWYVVIDAGSFFGKIKCLVKFAPEPGSAEGTRTVQPEVKELSHAKAPSAEGGFAPRRKLKVFVTHYFKDRTSIAAPLAAALEEKGVTANYEDYMLEPGHDLEAVIKDGLARYKFGVFVVSRSLLKAGWKQNDMEYLKRLIAEKNIHPIWYNITKEQLASLKPELEASHAGGPLREEIPELADDVIGWLL